jgi:hypothetical protein
MAISCGDDAARCAQEILLTAREVCTQKEVEKGRVILDCFLKAIASSVKQHPVEESFEERQFQGQKNIALIKWGRLKTELEAAGACVEVPVQMADFDWKAMHIAKARMSLNSSLPDPYLVAVKAAINYSAVCGKKLMPAYSAPDCDNSSNGEVNTSQMQEDLDDARDFTSVAASFSNPNRQFNEMYSGL